MILYMNKLKRAVLSLLYALPFGMKGMNDIILTQKASSNSDDVNTHETIKQNSLKQDLLRGEVTQEVKELRYTTYRVYNESKNYKYLGDGLAKKNSKKITLDNSDDKKFSLENKIVCEDVLHELQRVEKEGEERYNVSFEYDGIVKFKLEQFLTHLDIDITKDYGKVSLHFSAIPNKYNIKSKPFVATLKGIYTTNNFRNEILNSLLKIGFTTYKAQGEDDLMKYDLISPRFESIIKGNLEYIVTFNCEEIIVENLIGKYKSDSMEEKYNNKVKKTNELDINNSF